MISFVVCILVPVSGYVFYGKYVDRAFSPDGRQTPALDNHSLLFYRRLPVDKVIGRLP